MSTRRNLDHKPAVHTYTTQRLEVLAKKGRVIVLLKKKVYDVTDFVEDHPGGADLIKHLRNTDITEIMADSVSHTHSESAYEMLEDYFIGLHSDITLTEAQDTESALKEVTDVRKDFDENHFLDLDRPLLLQVFRAHWTKEFYLQQVHKPRHYGKGSAPVFGNFLEPLSKTPWWVIPLVHLPINALFVNDASSGNLATSTVCMLYAFGLFLWTLVEYGLHRFVFHLDDYLPDNQYAFTFHFLLHGIHHFLPMDRYRLVMPPALMVVITTPLWFLCHAVFRTWYVSQAVFAGAYLGYIFYDCTHYFLHHKSLPTFMKPTKEFHLEHHYKNYELGFGVTSRFWDVVFNTQFVDTSKF